MSHDAGSPDERDTLPPGPPDPHMEIAMRLEAKLDRLTAIAMKFFDLSQEHRANIDSLREDVDFLKRQLRSEPPNGAGHVV